MRLIEFQEQTCVIAKDQPQYNPLPARRFAGKDGRIACCWRLSLWERLTVLFTGVVWHQVLTFNEPLQPQLLTVDKPEMREPEDGLPFTRRGHPGIVDLKEGS